MWFRLFLKCLLLVALFVPGAHARDKDPD
ncbi:MAG: hypothetical protein RIS35_2757, partial [Pseudomonadota bacterium]